MAEPEIASRIAQGDVTLFDAIPAELTTADRRSLLAIQDIVARRRGTYRYLEIGSHKGGSIQPHLVDPRCLGIVSIDPRPLVQADERGSRVGYPDNSTAAMMEGLGRLSPTGIRKVHAFEMTAAGLAAERSGGEPADLVFIDGEHTDRAASEDFRAVRQMARPDAIIVFHDAPIVYRAILREMKALSARGTDFVGLPLPDTLFVVMAADAPTSSDFGLLVARTGEAYLTALSLGSGYRDFYRLPVFRGVRWVLRRLGLGHLASTHEYGHRRGSEPLP
jgi:hypothetical protein